MPDLEKLRYAVSVAREGSLSAASLSLPLSQSALTRSIQSLEREYGIHIFERSKAGARLTADGAAFVAHAESLLQHADTVEEELRAVAAGQQVTVAFGMGSVSATLFLPDALPGMLTQADGVRFRIAIGSNSLLRDMLIRGEIEFYVGGVPRDSDNFLTSSGLRMERIAGSSRLELMVREGHPLDREDLTREMLQEYPIVSPPFVRDTLQNTDIEALGISRPVIELDDFALLAQLVTRSDAILVTSSVFATHPLSRSFVRLTLELTPLRPVTYALISRADHRFSPATRRIADRIQSMVARVLGPDPR